MPHRSFLELALRGDRPGVRAHIALLQRSGYDLERIALEIIRPALVEVGERWMRNELSVADEHLVSAIAERVLAELEAPLAPPEQAPLVLLASSDSETHRIGQQILEGMFMQAGYRVQALGAQVPAMALLDMAKRLRPAVIGLSVTMSYHVPEIRKTLALLRSAFDRREVTLLVGGAVFESMPELRTGLDADWVGFDAREALRFVQDAMTCRGAS